MNHGFNTAVIQAFFRKSVLCFIVLAFALADLAGETVRAVMHEGASLPEWGMVVLTTLSLVAYLALLMRYLRRREGLFRSRREIEWRRGLLEKGPIALLVERPDEMESTPQVDEWLDGLKGGGKIGKLIKLDDLAPYLIERDRANYLAAVTALRDEGKHFTLNVTLEGGRPLHLTGMQHRTEMVLWLRDTTEEKARDSAWQAARAGYESEIAKLTTITETLPRPLWLRRISGQIIWCNEAYAKAMEASRADIIEQQIEFAPKSRYEAARALVTKAVETDKTQSEDRRVVVEGTRKLFRIVETPVMMEGYIVGVAFDQTDLEEARAEIKRHQDGFEETLEQLATPMAIFGADQRLQFSNQSYVRLWNLEESFLKTKPTYGDLLEKLRELRKIPEVVDFQRWKREQLGIFTSLIGTSEEMLHLPDGTTIRQIIIPHPLGGMMFVTEDVTDKLQLESSYNTLIAVQRETLDNLAEGIVVLGSDGRVKLYNPSFARIWDLDGVALEVSPHIGEVLEQMRPLLDETGPGRIEWSAYRHRVVAEMLHREPATRRIQRQNRSIIEHSSVPLPDGNVLHSYLDVSDTVRVEQALRETNKALAAADRLKSEFVANVSYQLRTPLSTIIGYAEILTNQYFGEMNERQLDYAKTILEASRKLLALINTVLDLATIEAGRMILNRRPIAIGKLVRSALDTVEGWATRQQIMIAADVPAALEDAPVEVDERRMNQVLFNLLTNAVQYTPPGGRITISATRDDKMMSISVADTGIGMTAEEQANVFTKFERANQSARQPGVGLGLSLVRSLVELHGGHVTLVSTVGQGTVVTCTLPLHGPRRAIDRAAGDDVA